jgi:hypothetical protein
VPCGVIVVQNKRGHSEIWAFRACIEEGPNIRHKLGDINGNHIKIHWTKTNNNGH